MRRKGTVDLYACRAVDFEKGLSERRSATVGYGEGGDGEEWRCQTPSISRTYFGLNFFFWALHCARTRSRRRISPRGSGSAPAPDPDAKGSHHHPTRSIPPSALPPTHRRAIDKCACSSCSERCSNAAPRCTAESMWRGGEGSTGAVRVRRCACSSVRRRHVLVRLLVALHVVLLTSHSVIFGRSIKNEYLTLGTLFTVGATVFALKGGKKDAASKPLSERVRDAVPIKAESRCVLFFSHRHGLMYMPARKRNCKCAVYIARAALYDVL